jgi:SpoVK/Ycf46/Vps4 family AAA+-type ATPase
MELTLKELKPLLKYIINNNDILEEHGKLRTAINICGEAGYGKSQIVEEVANEMGANFIKLSLAMVSETGDLSGYPVCLHYACKDDGTDCQ